MKLVWKGDKVKDINLKRDGISVNYRFVPGQEIPINEDIEKVLKKKMKDDIDNGRLVITGKADTKIRKG